MKRLLLTLMLILVSTSALAEWTAVGEAGEYTQYVDFATIRKSGNKVKMWGLLDYKTVQEGAGNRYSSSKGQREYDCKEEQWRQLAFTWFSGNMGRGLVVYSHGDPSKWRPMAPESSGEALWKIACGATTEWTKVDENDFSVIYADLATTRREGNKVKMWDLIDFKTVKEAAGDRYLSAKAHREYDCKEEQARILSSSGFSKSMGVEPVVNSGNNSPGEWRALLPESAGGALWKIACGKR